MSRENHDISYHRQLHYLFKSSFGQQQRSTNAHGKFEIRQVAGTEYKKYKSKPKAPKKRAASTIAFN